MIDTATQLANGMPGEPLPYLLRTDGMVTTVIFLCFILVSVIFSRGRKRLLQGIKSFGQNRERPSLFDEVTSSDAHHTLLLIFHCCVMLGLCIYRYLSHTTPILFAKFSHPLLLVCFVGSVLAYVIVKWILYSFINWTFFQKARNILWMASFFNLFIWLGILLLPLVLLTVYFNISPQMSNFLIAFLLILAKTALFWKCFSNFFEKIYGTFHLILYFCALEILPDLILWKGIELITNILIFKL